MSKRLMLPLLILFLSFTSLNAEPLPLRPKPHEGYEVKDGKIYFRRGNAGIILEVANSQIIEKYYSDRGAQIENPFARLGGDVQNGAIFLVTLLNRTNGSLTFTPRYVVGRIKTEAFFPLDSLTMMEVFEDMDARKRKILEKSIFHTPELLQPGMVVSKFLVFPALPKKFEDIRLQFDYLYFENAEIKSDFFFTTKEVE
ncbi:hypothetical protein L0222_24055 [bacterium]|nr:hypothetical protein [bacterium]